MIIHTLSWAVVVFVTFVITDTSITCWVLVHGLFLVTKFFDPATNFDNKSSIVQQWAGAVVEPCNYPACLFKNGEWNKHFFDTFKLLIKMSPSASSFVSSEFLQDQSSANVVAISGTNWELVTLVVELNNYDWTFFTRKRTATLKSNLCFLDGLEICSKISVRGYWKLVIFGKRSF